MDLGIREWLLIIGGLLLLILIVDGYRRIKKEQDQASDTQNSTESDDPFDITDPLISDSDLNSFDDQRLDPQIPILMDSIDEQLSDIHDTNHQINSTSNTNDPSNNNDKTNDHEAPQILIIYLNAKSNTTFDGHELIQALQQHGLKYGNMKIFHRYSRVDGRDCIRFSVINAIEPGYFDLQSIDELITPCISLFLDINHHPEPENALADMIETAYQLAEALDAELKDEQRSVLTKQTLSHYKERIQTYRRLMLARRSS